MQGRVLRYQRDVRNRQVGQYRDANPARRSAAGNEGITIRLGRSTCSRLADDFLQFCVHKIASLFSPAVSAMRRRYFSCVTPSDDAQQKG